MILPYLPIDALASDITSALNRVSNLILEAPPGAGKTTRVPALLMNHLAGPISSARRLQPDVFSPERASLQSDVSGQILVLEPRRLAARMAARHVAEEQNCVVGSLVGYQVRFEDVTSAQTRLTFLTEGVFLRRLLTDPTLAGVSVVVLDEFHERHLQTDLAISLLKRLQQTTRPDLKIVVMSATLNSAPIATFLGNCEVLRSEGKLFEVETEFARQSDQRPLAEQVVSALKQLAGDRGLDGDVLVFLPGAAEIRKCRDACEPLAKLHNWLVLPLHGDLTPEEQDRAVRAAEQTKIILATNVAESSVTIDGVVTVIDSGLARVAKTSPWTGFSSLEVAKVSRASVIQRAGRAGRTRAGRCLRLFTRFDFEARPAQDLPEIKRTDLAETVLALRTLGIDPTLLDWFDPPSEAALSAADTLLQQLGATDNENSLTKTGRDMALLPLHPRFSRLLVETKRQGIAAEGCILAALLGERDIRVDSRTQLHSSPQSRRGATSSSSDVLEQFDLFCEAERMRFVPDRVRMLGLDVGTVRRVERARQQVHRLITPDRNTAPAVSPGNLDEVLLKAVLVAFPDRVGRRRARTSKEFSQKVVLSSGGEGILAETSSVRQAEFLVAVQAEDQAGKGVLIRVASAIEPEWLLEFFPDRISEQEEIGLHPELQRVEVYSQVRFDQLVIDYSQIRNPNPEKVAAELARAALAAGLFRFVEQEKIDRWLARVAFVRTTFPEKNFPEFTDEDMHSAVVDLCQGLKSFAELRQIANDDSVGLLAQLRERLSGQQRDWLERFAPEFTSLSGRKRVRINYVLGQKPWVASRLQDFFGMQVGPMIGGGSVPVVLHLLAPSQRPVQVTTDLAGFWERHYPQIRRELCRRYPKHAWPEDPRLVP
ncbi:MAG TPA: ATP-dependent helicase HrpB [Acidobacteriota bacterium]|nr:ATP-dependent helicase HrpB [Acidobacteriota bacterium]